MLNKTKQLRHVQVSPGALESLKPVPGATSMYYAHIRLPEGFIGKSTIHINVDEISDLAGKVMLNAPETALCKQVKAT